MPCSEMVELNATSTGSGEPKQFYLHLLIIEDRDKQIGIFDRNRSFMIHTENGYSENIFEYMYLLLPEQ